MGKLEGRGEALAGTFKAQDVAITLCHANTHGGVCVFRSSRPCGRKSMGSYGSAATGVPGQACVLQYRAVVPAPSVLCVVQRGAGVLCGGDQRHAVFEGEMSCGVRGHTDSFVSVPQASERDAAPHRTVGGGRGSLPKVGVFHGHDRA